MAVPTAFHCTLAGGLKAWPPVSSWQTMIWTFMPAVALINVEEVTSPLAHPLQHRQTTLLARL